MYLNIYQHYRPPISTRLCGGGLTIAWWRSIRYFRTVPTFPLLLLPTIGVRKRNTPTYTWSSGLNHPDFRGNVLAIYWTPFHGLWHLNPKIPQNQSFSMIPQTPQFSTLFTPENHFFIEVSISTKKNLKAEMPNFLTKFSKQNCPRGVLVVGVSNQRLSTNRRFLVKH